MDISNFLLDVTIVKMKSVAYMECVDNFDVNAARELFSTSIRLGKDIIVNDNKGKFLSLFRSSFLDCAYEIITIDATLFEESNEAVLVHDLLEVMQPRYRPLSQKKIIFILNADQKFCVKCYKVFCDDLRASK